jgi:Aerotolerance regulator N-terminal
MEAFLNPWYMVAGGAMVSSPVLIHLINRMRFRRIRWAAMEFLLKSQKRNRRRLIIEQLILLLLRCLLVILAALLVARFVGSALGLTPTSSTTHVVILDDTLSMADRAPQNQSPGPDCFSVAKQQIKELAKYASEANSTQRLIILPMSNPKQKIFDDSLNKQGILGKLAVTLDGLTPTLLHADTLAAIEEARTTLGNSRESKRWLHLVSDFRDADWGRKSGTERLYETLTQVADTGANVTFIDTAAPARPTSGSRQVDPHNNYAVLSLRPEKRVAPGGTNVNFTVELANYGTDTREKVFLSVYLDGAEDHNASTYYNAPPPGGKPIAHTFPMLFTSPDEGEKSKFHRITVKAQTAPDQPLDATTGLSADNAAHAIIEVRREVPTLVIDGAAEEGLKPGGDTNTIENALKSATGNEAVKVVVAGLDELLRPDLEREYAAIYLLNVEKIAGRKDKEGKGADLPLKRLQQYVKNGGNVAFFTGDRIDVNHYNKVLFNEYEGLFPIPLERQASDEISKEEIERRRNSTAPKIYVLEAEHTITRGIAPLQSSIPDLIIARHTPAKDRLAWAEPSWSRQGDLTELITLANLRQLNNNTRTQIQTLVKRLPVDETEMNKLFAGRPAEFRKDLVKYIPLLEAHRDRIIQASLGKEDKMYLVAEAFDDMLQGRNPNPVKEEPKVDDKTKKVSLVDFWALSEVKTLKEDIQNFRKDALYGSPLVVTRRYGKGNVVACLTTAGSKWSGWSGGELGGVSSFTFPMLIVDLQKFLTHGGDAGGRMVGDSVMLELDPKRYQNQVQFVRQAEEGRADPGKAPETNPDLRAPLGMKAEPVVKLPMTEGVYRVKLESKEPGAQFVRLFPLSQGAPKEPMAGEKPGEAGASTNSEERWYAYNLDTLAESNLRRAATHEVVRPTAAGTEDAQQKGKLQWFDPKLSQDTLRERKADLSEMPWLFLLFLIVLVVEQALAVHLSFHARGTDASHAGSAPAAPAAAVPAAA